MSSEKESTTCIFPAATCAISIKSFNNAASGNQVNIRSYINLDSLVTQRLYAYYYMWVTHFDSMQLRHQTQHVLGFRRSLGVFTESGYRSPHVTSSPPIHNVSRHEQQGLSLSFVTLPALLRTSIAVNNNVQHTIHCRAHYR
jgi:hypothetical protein